MGTIVAYMTGDRITPESAEFGAYDQSGWVSPSWSRKVFYDTREEVSPLFELDEKDSGLADAVTDALNELGSYEDNGNGSFYGYDSVPDWESDADYSYAVHFSRKTATLAGYVEEDWHPGSVGIDLNESMYYTNVNGCLR